MRTTLILALAAVSLVPLALLAPAKACPAYKADKVIGLFVKDRAASASAPTVPLPKRRPPVRFDLLGACVQLRRMAAQAS